MMTTTTSAMCISVKYKQDLYSVPYPDSKMVIRVFAEQLKKDFEINESIPVALHYNDKKLLPSATFGSFQIPSDSELELKVSAQSLTIRIQKLSNNYQELHYTIDTNTTINDLYKKISAEIPDVFPLLFNHRMHLFETNSTELVTSFFKLINHINWKTTQIPHFYMFECPNIDENEKYTYDLSNNGIFLANSMWQPTVEQSPTALSLYLNSLMALVQAFNAGKDVENDVISNTHMAQFFLVLRHYLFPPACLALFHLTEGRIFNFEKKIISQAFYQLSRDLLPLSIPDTEVFLYIQYIFYWIFEKAQYASNEYDCYQNIQLVHDDTAKNTDAEESNNDPKYFKRPVCYITTPNMATATQQSSLSAQTLLGDGPSFQHMSLVELADAQKAGKHSTEYIAQTDIASLLNMMDQKCQSDDDKAIEFFREYTIWIPDETKSLYSIGNIAAQKSKLERFSDINLANIKQALATKDAYSMFTFVEPSALSKNTACQFVFLKTSHIVYLSQAAKSTPNLYNVFSPLDSRRRTITLDDVETDETELNKHTSFPFRQSSADVRKIEQITIIIFDVSYSMQTSIIGTKTSNRQSLLDLSIKAVGMWRDRLVSYRLAHAVGLIYFGAKKTTTTDLINEKCPITTDFSELDKALADRPVCGNSTPFLDAIDLAIKQITFYRERTKHKLSRSYRQLILCVSDGEDNCSEITKEDVISKLLEERIIFDSVSFQATPSLVMIELCEQTKGFYYTEVPHDEEGMINLFELEASISVSERDESICGKIKKPQRRQPKRLHDAAIHLDKAKISDGQVSAASLKNIMRELHDLRKHSVLNFEIFICRENAFFWKVIMHGPDLTHYAGGRWLLSVEFPMTYPQLPPEIRFVTPIYHCNINDDGKICHDILRGQWSQNTKMSQVFQQILHLLEEPNPEDALSTAKGARYLSSKDNYYKEVIESKQKYATATVDELKAQYKLE